MSKFNAWLHRQAPTRDSFERSRFLRPFAQRVFPSRPVAFYAALGSARRSAWPAGRHFPFDTGCPNCGRCAAGAAISRQYPHRRGHDVSEHARDNPVHLAWVGLCRRIRASAEQWVRPVLRTYRDVGATVGLG